MASTGAGAATSSSRGVAALTDIFGEWLGCGEEEARPASATASWYGILALIAAPPLASPHALSRLLHLLAQAPPSTYAPRATMQAGRQAHALCDSGSQSLSSRLAGGQAPCSKASQPASRSQLQLRSDVRRTTRRPCRKSNTNRNAASKQRYTDVYSSHW